MKKEQRSQNLLLKVDPCSTFRNNFLQPAANVFVARQVEHAFIFWAFCYVYYVFVLFGIRVPVREDWIRLIIQRSRNIFKMWMSVQAANQNRELVIDIITVSCCCYLFVVNGKSQAGAWVCRKDHWRGFRRVEWQTSRTWRSKYWLESSIEVFHHRFMPNHIRAMPSLTSVVRNFVNNLLIIALRDKQLILALYSVVKFQKSRQQM